MTQPPPTRLVVEPPIDQWRVTPRNGRTTPVIATGHQPYLWHPGILAKDIAADLFAEHVGGRALHVVVEHNPIGVLGIDLPVKDKHDALGVRRLLFDPTGETAKRPPNRVSPLEPKRVAEVLADQYAAAHGIAGTHQAVEHITEAYASVGRHEHLAVQTTAVLNELKAPYLTTPMPTLATSELVTQGFVDRLLSDPAGCARAYNRAVHAYPEAHMRPLHIGYETIEVPLWAQADGLCTPVYADIGDSRSVELITQDGAIDLTGPDALQYLRPRAATLSAIMRSEHCDLFIHGLGGGVYEQVTERWWQDWAGEELAPMAVVSADAYLAFDAPLASRAERDHAVWFGHHLPFNVDRYAEPTDDEEAAIVQEKRELLDHMDDDRDKRRRAKAFKRIHEINARLRRIHHQMLLDARLRIRNAQIGVTNARVAHVRTWCFALYPDMVLRDLCERFSSRLSASR